MASSASQTQIFIDELKSLGFVTRTFCVPRRGMLSQITDEFEITVTAAGEPRVPDPKDERFDVSFLSHSSNAWAPERRENLDSTAALKLVKSLMGLTPPDRSAPPVNVYSVL